MARHNVELEVAGSVFCLEANVGDTIALDDLILILDRMKMEIAVLASAAGRIAELMIETGSVVEEGQLLTVIKE